MPDQNVPPASVAQSVIVAGSLPGRVAVCVTVNGEARRLEIAPWTTLLDLLREKLGLTATKKGCEHGQCGSCTVLVNGLRVNSCLTLAVMQDGTDITTVEGLASVDGELHAIQCAFMDHDASECGCCIPA